MTSTKNIKVIDPTTVFAVEMISALDYYRNGSSLNKERSV
jgi:hypothetical protein